MSGREEQKRRERAVREYERIVLVQANVISEALSALSFYRMGEEPPRAVTGLLDQPSASSVGSPPRTST